MTLGALHAATRRKPPPLTAGIAEKDCFHEKADKKVYECGIIENGAPQTWKISLKNKDGSNELSCTLLLPTFKSKFETLLASPHGMA